MSHPDRHPDADTLLDHALGLLAAGARAGVEGHLDGCAVCRERAAALQAEQDALSAGLRAEADVDPAAARAIERRVLEALRAPAPLPAPARRRGPARRLLVAAAVGLVAAGLVVFADQREQAARRATLVKRVQTSERAALEGALR